MEKYAYVKLSSSVDQTLYADNKDDGLKLLNYYKELNDYNTRVESGEIDIDKYFSFITGDTLIRIPISIPVPVKYLSVAQKVFVAKEIEEEALTKAYVFNTQCWGFFEAYVPLEHLHDSLPSDSTFKDFKTYINSLPNSNNLIYRSPSPFGFYCN